MNALRLAGEDLRIAPPSVLVEALRQSRADTLVIGRLYEQAPAVPLCAGLNPPRWELGHIG